MSVKSDREQVGLVDSVQSEVGIQAILEFAGDGLLTQLASPANELDQDDDELTASGLPSIDVIDEMRLRTWARRNFVPAIDRDPNWHPIVLDEMQRRDAEQLTVPAGISAR
jgi:hypothetical protein